jgi:M6 family metalloprotease-like protein
MHNKVTISCIVLLSTILLLPANAIIVWEGKIVSEWPDQNVAPLRKKAEGQSRNDVTDGFGFYPHPKGTIYGITMIVDFSDQPAKFTREQVSDWLNKQGFSLGTTKGSVRDYFYECSNGKVTLNNDVVGYYRAKKPKSYYESTTGYSKATELVNELITYFDPSVDFSKYDNDGNGTTESISIVYAGSGQTWGQGLWPHAGSIGQTKDGVRLNKYNMCDMGNNLTLYVFCHETGHMIFGWPDLYWFGDYCLMGNRMSDPNPQAINDFFRADQGWIETETITSLTNATYRTWHNHKGYRFVNPSNAQEMFFWSEIKNSGRWSNVRGKGLLLYRFNATIRGNNSGTQRTLSVVEADGNNAMAASQWPSPGSAATDFFYQGNKNEFSSATTPSSQWGLRIYDISAANDTMFFSVGTRPVSITHAQMHKAYSPQNTITSIFDLRGSQVGIVDVTGVSNKLLPCGAFIYKNMGTSYIRILR